ncbi:hypothetical protein PO909_027354 [Leuciscus waleckii]
MTAGTVVITGGILATVILLCIIVVLCYCRLQYYCCKKNGSDPDASPEPTPPQSFCPTCSPYGSPFYIHTMDETRNGGERITYMPSHYNSPPLSLTLPSLHSASLSSRSRPDLYSNTRAISTDV